MIYTHAKGKVIATCTEPRCGWHSKKVDGLEKARSELAHHNFLRHPGLYPRWNQYMKAVEKTKGVRYG